MNSLTRACAASLGVMLAVSSAQAGILASGTRVTSFEPLATPSAVPLRENGASVVPFRTVRDNTTVSVTYNAECSVRSSVLGDHVLVWITIDGVAQTQDFAFCSVLTLASQTHIAASRRAVVRVPKAGLHRVRVFARLSENTTGGALDDSSIVIED